jgi:uncharacterized protein (DUF1499 family)
MVMKLIIAVLILVGLGLAVRIYMSRPVEDTLRPDEHVEIRELRDPIPGNAFLACPPDYCRGTAGPSPIFSLPADRLAELWTQMLADQPRIVVVSTEPNRHRIVVIQHTSLLRFPDVITAEVVALGPDRSSVAVYSKARYGTGDFGTNQRRVEAWLNRLQILAAGATSR